MEMTCFPRYTVTNYQKSMLVETTACQSWHIFLSHNVLMIKTSIEVKFNFSYKGSELHL